MKPEDKPGSITQMMKRMSVGEGEAHLDNDKSGYLDKSVVVANIEAQLT